MAILPVFPLWYGARGLYFDRVTSSRKSGLIGAELIVLSHTLVQDSFLFWTAFFKEAGVPDA